MDDYVGKSYNSEMGVNNESCESCSDYKRDYINLSSVRDTGYYFDDDGILRYIKDNSPFPFKSLLVPLFKVRYDIFRALTAKHVRELLHNVGVVSEILYTPKIPNGIRILHSESYMNHPGPLLVFIQAGGVSRAGVWSSRLLMHSTGGINIASQLQQIKLALESNFAVLVINPNEKISTNTYSKDLESSPEEIIHSVWSSVIPKCQSSQILIWAHMYGGTAFLYPLQPPPDLKSVKKSSISLQASSGYLKNNHSFLDSYDSSQFLPKFQQKSLYQFNQSLVNAEIIANTLNCVAMDFAASKILSKSDSLDMESRFLTSVAKPYEQSLLSSNSTNAVLTLDGRFIPNYGSSTSNNNKPIGLHLNSSRDCKLDSDSLIDTTELTSLQPLIDLENCSSSKSNSLENGVVNAKQNSYLLSQMSSLDSRKANDSCSLTADCTSIKKLSAPKLFRKRTSICSNNATDNSSLHSENSMSAFSASSPKQQRCSHPMLPESSSEKSKKNVQSPIEIVQRQINDKWNNRRTLFWKSIKDKVAGIIFTDSALCLKMQGIMDPEVHSWFNKNSLHYVACMEELSTDLNKSSFSINEVPTRSAGTAEHDIIPHLITNEAFAFFKSQLSRVSQESSVNCTESSQKNDDV